jgi:hypothetical protein
MPIVINEIEIVPEPPAPAPEATGARAPERDEQPPIPEPWEILKVERIHLARLERVRAD